jgi:hypothetical protein
VLLLVTSILDGHATLPNEDDPDLKLAAKQAGRRGVMDAVTTILPCKHEIVAATSYNNSPSHVTALVEGKQDQTVSKNQDATSCDNSPSHVTAAVEATVEDEEYDNYEEDKTVSKIQVNTQHGIRIAAIANPDLRHHRSTDISVSLAGSQDDGFWDKIKNTQDTRDTQGFKGSIAWKIYQLVTKRSR